MSQIETMSQVRAVILRIAPATIISQIPVWGAVINYTR